MSLEDAILARIRPTPEEETTLEAMVHDLLAAVQAVLRDRGWEAKPFVSGSVAKGTHLTGADVDLFVAFPELARLLAVGARWAPLMFPPQ